MMDWLESDLARYEREQEAYEASLPSCDECGEKVNDEYMWEIDGKYMCETCVEEWLLERRIHTESLVDDYV